MKRLIIVVLCLVFRDIHAQKQLIRTIAQPGIIQVAVDRAGDLYATTASAIYKYNKNGELLATLRTTLRPTLFDPGNGVRLLAFFRDSLEYAILSPSLEQRSIQKLDPSFAIEPWLVCSSGDYNLLILDAADWSIKTIDTRNSNVDQEVRLDTTLLGTPDISFMREYQGFLFLLDSSSGILILNRLGMIVQKLFEDQIKSFYFLGQDLYYYKDGRIHFTDLFSLQSRSEPFDYPCREVVLTDERSIAVRSDGITIFSYSPSKSSSKDR
jgi:hypothetical protein